MIKRRILSLFDKARKCEATIEELNELKTLFEEEEKKRYKKGDLIGSIAIGLAINIVLAHMAEFARAQVIEDYDEALDKLNTGSKKGKK